jgi:hypothetical protein
MIRKGTCMLIDDAISGVTIMIKKEDENILIYKDFTIKIQYMWYVKTKVIPAIIRATGIISKSIRKYLSNMPGKHKIKNLTKTSTLDTAIILQNVLM